MEETIKLFVDKGYNILDEILIENKKNTENIFESLEKNDKNNFLTTNCSRVVITNKEPMDLTFRESAVKVDNIQDDSSKSSFLRFHKILTESFEIEDDLNDIPSKTVKEIPVFLTNKVLKYRNLVFPHRMFPN